MSTYPFINTSGSFPDAGKPLGCEECNRQPGDEHKFWPIFTITYNGQEVCAKCLTSMAAGRRKREQ